MSQTSLRIVYMGTPGFAVAPLQALLSTNHQVVAVVTATDKPAGRGMNLQPSAVKTFALEHNLPVLQPESLKSEEFIAQLNDLQPDLMVVVAFRMLPRVVWALPRFGTLNLHASLLPQYRGAAPINWAIINGETETGITTFFINEEIDTGAIIKQHKTPIPPHYTAGHLHDDLMTNGAQLVVETVDAIAAGTVKPIPQTQIQESDLRPAPKLNKENCRINWQRSGISVQNLVRGLAPIPGAWTQYCVPNAKPLQLKVFETEIETGSHTLTIGTVVSDNKTYIKVAVVDGFVLLRDVQLEGKKRMKTDELLRGFKIAEQSNVS